LGGGEVVEWPHCSKDRGVWVAWLRIVYNMGLWRKHRAASRYTRAILTVPQSGPDLRPREAGAGDFSVVNPPRVADWRFASS